MRTYQLFFAFFVISIFCSSILNGQSTKKTKTGILSGHLIDCYGNIVKGAKIKVANQEVSKKQKSDKRGVFKLKLPVGIYEITVEKCGFKKVIIQKVEVQDKSEKNITVDMQVSIQSHGQICTLYANPCPPSN